MGFRFTAPNDPESIMEIYPDNYSGSVSQGTGQYSFIFSRIFAFIIP